MSSIAFALDEWNPQRGGAERAFDLFARHLIQQGHDVCVTCLSAAPPSQEQQPGPRIVRVQAPRLPRSLGAGRFERLLGERLVKAAEGEGCDLIVGLRHLPRADFLWPHGGAHRMALEARARARGQEVTEPKGRHRHLIALERNLLESTARKIVCVSELVREEFAALYPTSVERLVVIPNGVDRSLFCPRGREQKAQALRERIGLAQVTAQEDGAPDVPLLTFVARDPELKGLGLLFDALAGLEDHAWRLLVAGPKHLEPWQARAAQLGLRADRLHFVSDGSAAELFAASDLVVHPTFRDTSGLVILEALSSGVPVITTTAAGDHVLISDESHGSTIESGAINQLQSALAAWLERLRREAPAREELYQQTKSRALQPWLACLEQELLTL